MVLASSTLVNVAEDAELRLVRWLADAAPAPTQESFVKDCESCILEADAASLIKTIVGDTAALQALFALEQEHAVSAFSLLAALLDRIEPPEQAPQLAAALADAIVNVSYNQDENTVERRILLLSTLYNVRSEGREKCALLTRMIKLASQQQQPPTCLMEGQPLGSLILEDTNGVPTLVVMMDGWDVPMQDRRELFKAVTAATPWNVARKQRFTLLLAETYTDKAQVDADGVASAKDAAIGALRDPVTLFVQQRNMLSLPAVQALEADNGTTILHGLLAIFQEGKLEDYEAFLRLNGGESSVLEPFGLDHKECVRYMRILSLCSLAADQEEIPYKAVAITLKLPSENEVESWVIAAVSSGLLVAKMDQLQQKVMVERSVVRRFDMEQWKALQSRLNAWKQNVRGVLDGFKQSRQVGTNS